MTNLKIEEIKREECSHIIDFLKQQLIISPGMEDYLGAKNRVHAEIAPYTKKEQDNHKHYDSLHWEILLNSKEIPEGSTLYIYTKDKGFFRNHTHSQGLHPLLIREWAVLKKGELKLYMHTEEDKKFCPQKQEAQENFPPQERFPSFYVDRVLDSRTVNMDLDRRAQELKAIQELFSKTRNSMNMGLDYETQELFEDLFYRIRRAQRRGYIFPHSEAVVLEAHVLYDRYRNMQ